MMRWSKLISDQADSKILWDATGSLDANCGRTGRCKPQCSDDSLDAKNDSIFGARCEMQYGRFRCFKTTRKVLLLIRISQQSY